MIDSFKLSIVAPHSKTTHTYGGTTTVRTYGDKLYACWSFNDGMEVSFRNNVETFISRNANGRRSVTRTSERELNKKARVYVSDDRPFNLIEDLANRTRRPYDALRSVAIDGLARIGIDGVKLAWSQYAGCSACPCSPGFVVTSSDPDLARDLRGLDIWVTAPDVPVVDETKPARDLSWLV